MARLQAANYGFTKTTVGDETTFQVKLSARAKAVTVVWSLMVALLVLLICIIPGAMKGGDANSFSAGLATTLSYFIPAILALAILRFLFVRGPARIVVGPNTVSIGNKAYLWTDARNWHVANPRAEREEAIANPIQLVLRALEIPASYCVMFSYGQNLITAAKRLTEPQAIALLDDIIATANRASTR